MPTYKNGTLDPISWGGLGWMPGESKPTDFFLPTQLGLTKLSDSPVPDNHVLYCQDVPVAGGVPVEIDIPYPYSGVYELSVVSIGGDGRVSILNGNEIPIDANTDYIGRLRWKRSPRVTLSSLLGGTFRILAEGVEDQCH